MLDKIIEAKEIITFIIPLIISFVIVLSRLFKNKKLKKLAQNLLEIEKGVKEYMCQIEDFKNFTGEDKKEWVKTKVNQYCINNGIEYDETLVDEFIETFIKFSKTVNKREKEKGELL